MTGILKSRAHSYATADLDARGVDYRVDIRETGLSGSNWDVVIASHVLEHVEDDGRALRECHRLLRRGGDLVVMVPIVEAWSRTYEDESITKPLHRLAHFGKEDHVRVYGRDVRDRIVGAGFEITEFSGSPHECVEHGLTPGEVVFVARRGTG